MKTRREGDRQGPELPANEPERLAALLDYAILDTLPEQEYDDLTFLASQLCGTPIALLSLLDHDRQWFKARIGLEVSETPRNLAFCSHAILDPGKLMIVRDATQDSRFAENPLVTSDPSIRFYAGTPLVTSDGAGLGTLCVIDRVPRDLNPQQQRGLVALGRQAMGSLELRKAIATIAQHSLDRHSYEEDLEKYRHELEVANTLLQEETLTDSLTDLRNRRAFEQTLESEIERSTRYSTPLSLALVDIDYFKPFNDEFGHLEGDAALRQLAKVLAQTSRQSDSVFRIGGEEFGIILPGVKTDQAVALGQRLREAVEGAEWPRRSLTVSIGVAEHGGEITTRSELLTRADEELYRAKALGRNRVCGG